MSPAVRCSLALGGHVSAGTWSQKASHLTGRKTSFNAAKQITSCQLEARQASLGRVDSSSPNQKAWPAASRAWQQVRGTARWLWMSQPSSGLK